MRILYLGRAEEGNLEQSMSRAFERLGCQVDWLDTTGENWVAPLASSPLLQRVGRRLAAPVLPLLLGAALRRRTRRERYDLIFCNKTLLVDPRALRAVADAHGALLFCFGPDHPLDPHPSRSNPRSRALVPLVDCYFTFARFIVPALERAGARRVERLPFAQDPELHAPPRLTDADRQRLRCEVAFVGNHSEERERWMRELLDWDLGVWGHRWERAVARDSRFRRAVRGGAQYGREFARIYAAADIGLNLIQVYPDGHNMRSFEAPACGAFVLSNRTDELVELFAEGVEIACFGDAAELRAKVAHYLAHPEERARIAAAGRARVANETYDLRAQRILQVYQELRR